MFDIQILIVFGACLLDQGFNFLSTCSSIFIVITLQYLRVSLFLSPHPALVLFEIVIDKGCLLYFTAVVQILVHVSNRIGVIVRKCCPSGLIA